jgi:ABC-type multidrug transport system ATPase subunit
MELKEAAILARMEEKPDFNPLERTFHIEFENMSFTLPNGLQVISNVSGVLRPGRVCAIMGASGSGKTTLLTILMGKQTPTAGILKINGQVDHLRRYRRLIGYVPQEDIMIRELTIRDTLMHSARMRLPKDWTYQRVKKKVNQIISSLGIEHVSNSVIGNEEERGISGGQRKRVNIGMELVAEPSVLFLDEPTSGLDSSTAYDVCLNLRHIARQQGLTVAAVVHSPSPATFKQFDDLLLLGKGGKVIYMGPREKANDYFKACGFTCPPEESESDFFLDVSMGLIASEFDPAFKPLDLVKYWENRHVNQFYYARRMTRQEAYSARKQYHHGKGPKTLLRRRTTVKERVEESFGFATHLKKALFGIWSTISEYFMDIFEEIGSLFISRKDTLRETQSVFMQVWFLMRRAYQQVYRSFSTSLVDLAMNFAAGMFISVAVQNFGFIGAEREEMCLIGSVNMISRCRNPQDTLREAGMFICLGALFAGISIAGNTFGREKVVYWRDTSVGMSVIPYFLAKIIVDIPRVVLGSTVYSFALVMFFKYSQSFVSIYWIVLCLYFYAFALGYALSTAVPYQKFAIYGVGFSLLWALAMSGVIPALKDIFPETSEDTGYPEAVRWLWYVSGSRWAIEAFYISEIKALPFVENTRNPPFPYSYDNYFVATGYMWAISFGWLILTLVGLKLFNRSKF